MVKLEGANYPAAYALYRRHENFFPLIAAVLLDEQDGVVYADDPQAPRQVYVEHAFGFAQIFGSPVLQFEAALRDYLLTNRRFAASKIRLYTPYMPEFLNSAACDSLRSRRQRFIFDSTRDVLDQSREVTTMDVNVKNVDQDTVSEIESRFGVVGRFWRTPRDFIDKANAVVALVGNQAAAICYAAAVAENRGEIDVLTLPEYRHLGIGKLVVTAFAKRCLEKNVLPLWDCFTNNAGSMALCESAGFVPANGAYPFFTISK